VRELNNYLGAPGRLAVLLRVATVGPSAVVASRWSHYRYGWKEASR